MAGKRGNHEGTIWRRERDGLFFGRIMIEGKKYQVTGKTKTAVATKLKELRRKIEAGISVDSSSIKLGDFLDTWIEGARSHLAYRTVENYEQVIRDHLKPVLGSRPIGKIRPDEVQSLVNAMAARGYSPRSVQNARTILRRALNSAKTWRYIEHNPADNIDIPPLKRKNPILWSDSHVTAFLEAVKGHRYEGVYWVLIYLGLRKGEALALLREDVNLERRTLIISGSIYREKGKGVVRKETKNTSSHRTLPIPKVLMPILEKQLRTTSGAYLFESKTGTPIELRGLSRHFADTVEKLGLPKTTIHSLRHLAASELIRSGVDVRTVAAILGHASATTTMNIYAHSFEEGLRDAVEKRQIKSE